MKTAGEEFTEVDGWEYHQYFNDIIGRRTGHTSSLKRHLSAKKKQFMGVQSNSPWRHRKKHFPLLWCQLKISIILPSREYFRHIPLVGQAGDGGDNDDATKVGFSQKRDQSTGHKIRA